MKKILYIAFLLVIFVACNKDDQGMVTGTASANDGAILDGITVQLYTMSSELYQTTTTSSDGSYTIKDVESGNYYIAATVESGGETYDTGNTPKVIYVSGEMVKEVTLTLNSK